MKNAAELKIETAQERALNIRDMCVTYINTQDERALNRICAYIGDFATNLRSSLNYMVRQFAEKRIKPIVSSSKYKNSRNSQDFPTVKKKEDFDKRGFIHLLKENDQPFYSFLESRQPYHQDYDWLWQLTKISNVDKHQIVNEVMVPKLNDFCLLNADGTPIPKPTFFGDKLMIMNGGKPVFFTLPVYYSPAKLFATENGWVTFWIILEKYEQKITLLDFAQNTPRKVAKIINEFQIELQDI